MRMSKNLTPLTLQEHQQIAKFLLDFLENYEKCLPFIEKGFALNSPVIKKLTSMHDLGSFLKYTLQQGASLHRSKLAIKPADAEFAEWSKLYWRE